MISFLRSFIIIIERWRYIIGQALKTIEKRVKVEDMQVVYHLIFKNALYSFECYVEGREDRNKYCYIENITDDEGEAEAFLKLIVKGKALPVHIYDLAEDYFERKYI